MLENKNDYLNSAFFVVPKNLENTGDVQNRQNDSGTDSGGRWD